MTAMRTKQEVLDEIQRTANENGGKPPGIRTFEQETGIKPHEWGKFWARLSEAVKEAGLAPNQLQAAYSDDFLIQKFIVLAQKLRGFPTSREINVKEETTQTFQTKRFLRDSERKTDWLKRCWSFVRIKTATRMLQDFVMLSWLTSIIRTLRQMANLLKRSERYTFLSMRHYKIGKTSNAVRRGSELRLQMPETMNSIHSIKTDDPDGVEAYWHRRFDPKRLNGEWFALASTDIKAFRRWRRII
jgi:hypothetical protein